MDWKSNSMMLMQWGCSDNDTMWRKAHSGGGEDKFGAWLDHVQPVCNLQVPWSWYYSCGVAGYNKKKEKICVHVAIKCANCGGNHTANSLRCTSKHKADIETMKKEKRRRKGGKKKTQVENSGKKRMVENPEPSTKIDLEDERWAQTPQAERFQFDNNESQDYTLKYKIFLFKFNDSHSVSLWGRYAGWCYSTGLFFWYLTWWVPPTSVSPLVPFFQHYLSGGICC